MTKFDKIFSTHGIPNVVKTDLHLEAMNLTNSQNILDLRIVKLQPLWPRANGEVKRFIKTTGKVVKHRMQRAAIGNRIFSNFWEITEQRPILQQKFHQRKLYLEDMLKVRLSENPKITTFRKTEMRRRDANQKQKMKHYADKKNNAKHSSLSKGDRVIVQQKKHKSIKYLLHTELSL